jgi:hypothetical protein
MSKPIDIFVETGRKKVFAGAVDWPGWCRFGREEAAALEALLVAGPRYARLIRELPMVFEPPADTHLFRIVERAEGNATTSFGAPDIAFSFDHAPVDAPELARLRAILQASWRAFDSAVEVAIGKELKKGPRGGGRELQGIINHVVGAEEAYLKRLGWIFGCREGEDDEQWIAHIRMAMLDGLAASAAGQLPEKGPRGGKRWSARFFVRRAAWHVIDHCWEIEDRIV